MFCKWKLGIVLLSTFFSSAAFSADCENLFHRLDSQYISETDKDPQNKFIQMENDLFDAIEKCRKYSGMFVLMGELQIEMGKSR